MDDWHICSSGNNEFSWALSEINLLFLVDLVSSNFSWAVLAIHHLPNHLKSIIQHNQNIVYKADFLYQWIGFKTVLNHYPTLNWANLSPTTT